MQSSFYGEYSFLHLLKNVKKVKIFFTTFYLHCSYLHCIRKMF